MVDRFLYYLIVIPFSKLPFWFIYLIADAFYLVLLYIFPYRKEVITNNLQKSFPEKSIKEIDAIRKDFYRFFADLMLETIKLLGISEAELKSRITVENKTIVENLYKEGRSFILISSHYNNWEFLILAQDLNFPHQAIGIGMPLSNKFWHEKITAKRERFGMKVTDPKNYKIDLKNLHEPTSTLVLNDQSPGKNKNCFWTNFLNQQTAFYFGAEVLAHEQNLPVVFLEIENERRGYFNFKLELITDNPKTLSYGDITKSYIEKLAQSINAQPSRWLWSHKRWKKKIPENLETLKVDHKKRFDEKFRPQS